MSAAPIVVQVPAPAGERWNRALATPEAEPPTAGSAELEVTETEAPRTFAAAAGAVTAPVGFVLSTRTLVIVVEVKVLPALSVVITRRS